MLKQTIIIHTQDLDKNSRLFLTDSVRIFFHKIQHTQRRKTADPDLVHTDMPQLSGRLNIIAKSLDLCFPFIIQETAFSGNFQIMMIPFQKRDAQLLFQQDQILAQHGLSDIQFFRRPCNISYFGHDSEII